MDNFRKNFELLPFPENFSNFHPPKFLMTFFSHRPQISIFLPILPLSGHFPPVSQKILFPPILTNFPLFSKNSPAFYVLFAYFVSPSTLIMMHLCITQCTYWTPLPPPPPPLPPPLPPSPLSS